MNLAVIESMRHRGIARSLVTAALQTGLSQAAHRALLEVRASNRAAQTLYQGSWVSSDSREAEVLPQSRGRCRVDGVGPDCHRNRDPASMFAIMREDPDQTLQ